MEPRWKIAVVLVIGGLCVVLVCCQQPRRSLGVGSSIGDVDDYLVQETSRDHRVPFVRSTVYTGYYCNGRMVVFTRFGFRSGHYFAVRYQVLMQDARQVVGVTRGWIWEWDI